MSYDWIKEISSADLAKSSHPGETVVQAMNIQRGESYGGRFLPIITKSACGSEEGFSIPMGMRHLMCHVCQPHTFTPDFIPLRLYLLPQLHLPYVLEFSEWIFRFSPGAVLSDAQL